MSATAFVLLLLAAGCEDFQATDLKRDTGAADAEVMGDDTVSGQDTLSADTALPDTTTPDTAGQCGDGRLDGGEACDDRNTRDGDGCATDCLAVEPGFTCPSPGSACVPSAACGNLRLEGAESCDDGNTAPLDGCDASCRTESGWTCPPAGGPCVPTCGDGALSGPETCDDGNASSSDGCDASCRTEPGWLCPQPGSFCVAAACGDGIVAGFEDCEDDDTVPESGDGCTADCRLEPGWACDPSGSACHPSVCGDGVAEGTEQCDDANHDTGDGCTPLCEREPQCTDGFCTSTCGDGIVLPGEPCDDGNTRSGDGCSATCEVEPGFSCTLTPLAEPDALQLAIVLRDFRGCDLSGGHPDFECFGGDDRSIVGDVLSADGKPAYRPGASGTTPTTSGQAAFDQWYRDTPNVNLAVVSTITLARTGAGTYVYDNQDFFPLDGLGWVAQGSESPRTNGHNFHFTSEVRTWFEYEGDETLTFRGDDDVWVFINRRLALDIGGVHGAETLSITLDATQAQQLGLQVGGVYELAVFQAERHTVASSYQLTLSNFTKAHTSCVPDCGDGTRTPDEGCDDGNSTPGDGCSADCQTEPGYVCTGTPSTCEPIN